MLLTPTTTLPLLLALTLTPPLITARALLFPSAAHPDGLELQVLTADSTLSRRHSMPWADPYLAQPLNFTVAHISGCKSVSLLSSRLSRPATDSQQSYMLTFKRDALDTRYRTTFEVRHDHTLAPRTLPSVHARDGFALTAIATDGAYAPYVLSAHQLNGACSEGATGAPPSAFRVSLTLDQPAAYTNDWKSDPIYQSAEVVTPAVPQGVRVEPYGADEVVVSWEAVAGAKGYYVLVEAAEDAAAGEGGDGGGRSYATFVAHGQHVTTMTLPRANFHRAVVKACRDGAGVSEISSAQVVSLQ